MKFRLQTLVDITETRARRQDEDKFAYKQEANFQTVIQTIGLRANLFYDKSPQIDNISVLKLGFGDKYKGKQKVWTFDFEIESEGALSINTLNEDFNLVPVILELTETAKLEQALFRTVNGDTNIIFTVIN